MTRSKCHEDAVQKRIAYMESVSFLCDDEAETEIVAMVRDLECSVAFDTRLVNAVRQACYAFINAMDDEDSSE